MRIETSFALEDTRWVTADEDSSAPISTAVSEAQRREKRYLQAKGSTAARIIMDLPRDSLVGYLRQKFLSECAPATAST
jgi:hypothetical protein